MILEVLAIGRASASFPPRTTVPALPLITIQALAETTGGPSSGSGEALGGGAFSGWAVSGAGISRARNAIGASIRQVMVSPGGSVRGGASNLPPDRTADSQGAAMNFPARSCATYG